MSRITHHKFAYYFMSVNAKPPRSNPPPPLSLFLFFFWFYLLLPFSGAVALVTFSDKVSMAFCVSFSSPVDKNIFKEVSVWCHAQ